MCGVGGCGGGGCVVSVVVASVSVAVALAVALAVAVLVEAVVRVEVGFGDRCAMSEGCSGVGYSRGGEEEKAEETPKLTSNCE